MKAGETIELFGWTIQYNPKPIPDRSHDYDYWHEDNDVEGALCGTAASVDQAIWDISEICSLIVEEKLGER